MRNGIKLIGIKELEAKLRKNATLDDVKTIIKLNGTEMHQMAQRLSPVDTGFLRRSIVFRVADGGFSAIIEATADYAPYLEWGTRFMAAMPFIRPAYQNQKEQFKSDLRRLVE